MAKVPETTPLAYADNLDIFSTPICDLGTVDTKYIYYKPITFHRDQGSVKFFVPPNVTSYLDLSETYIKVTVKITKTDGSKLPEDGDESHVGPVNLFLHSLFDSVQCYLGDTLITNGQTNYSYKAMINALLDSERADSPELQCSMYYKDTGARMNAVNLTSGGNSGLKKRAAFFKGSQQVEMMGRLDLDVFKVQRLLLNGVSLSINLSPTNTAFRLLSANESPDYKIELVDISLRLTHVTPANHVLLAHQNVLKDNENMRANYYYMREDLRRFTIAKDASTFYLEDAFNGKIPDSCVLCFVPSANMSGSYTKNPYEFVTTDLQYISLTASGLPAPRGPITLDDNLFIDAYADLYQGKQMGIITREDFMNGYGLFRVDFGLNNKKADFYPAVKEGSVRIELRFKEPTAEPLIVLCLIKYPARYSIDYARNVYMS